MQIQSTTNTKRGSYRTVRRQVAGRSFFLLSVLLMLNACAQREKKPEAEDNVSIALAEEPNIVKTTLLAYSDFNHELISVGTVAARNKADLRFESSEIIERIHVKNGDRVKKGQTLALLDAFRLQNSLRQALDNLERARLELQDVLIGQGYSLEDSLRIPPEILKIAKVRSNYDNSRANVELITHNLAQTVLYAPFDGVVANLYAREYNLPPSGEAFCTIIGSGNLEADFYIPESELALVNIGDKALISSFSISNQPFDGRISEINPVIDKNGMVRIKAVINAGNARLYDGMNIKVRIQRFVERQLVIPKEALLLRNNRKVVFTYVNGKALWNYVETGLENSTGYVITDGLKEGDRVIYEGNINLAHETPVEVEN